MYFMSALDVDTPLSSLGIRQDLVTFGGFTADTARLALVDGQPPADFSRSMSQWLTPSSAATPALDYGYGSYFTSSATTSSLQTTAATTSTVSTPAITASTSLAVLPAPTSVTVVPDFAAISVPPVVTISTSPPARSITTSSVHYFPSSASAASPVLLETISPPLEELPSSTITSAPSSSLVPVLQWPSYPAGGPPAHMPILDQGQRAFLPLLSVPAAASSTSGPQDPLVPSSDHVPPVGVALALPHHPSSSTPSASSRQRPYPVPFTNVRRGRPISTHWSVILDSPPTPRSPVRAPSASPIGGPVWSRPARVQSAPPVDPQNTSSSEDAP